MTLKFEFYSCTCVWVVLTDLLCLNLSMSPYLRLRVMKGEPGCLNLQYMPLQRCHYLTALMTDVLSLQPAPRYFFSLFALCHINSSWPGERFNQFTLVICNYFMMCGSSLKIGTEGCSLLAVDVVGPCWTRCTRQACWLGCSVYWPSTLGRARLQCSAI